jgi:hypothetical protein
MSKFWASHILNAERRFWSNWPGFPKTVPIGLIANDRDVYKACSPASRLCLEEWSARRLRHSSSSFGEQALIVTSNNWWSHSNTNFQENGAVWHCSPTFKSNFNITMSEANTKVARKRNTFKKLSWNERDVPLPLSTSSTLTSHNPMQAWIVYICSVLAVDARMRKSRYRRHIRYWPSTPSRVCHETWRTPQRWIWPSARTELFERASGCMLIRTLMGWDNF